MFKIIIMIGVVIYFVVSFIRKGMTLLQILAHIPLVISIFAAVFGGSAGVMFIASIISGILTYLLSHNIILTIGITFVLLVHTAIFGDS